MRTLPILLAVSALALLSGCGSSSSSKARGYAETGQAINNVCKSADANVKSLGAQLTGNAKHDAPILDKLVSQLDKSFSDLKAIKPNDKLKSTFDQYVTAVSARIDEFKKIRDAAKSGNDAAYKAENTAASKLPSVAPLEHALGAPDCAASN